MKKWQHFFHFFVLLSLNTDHTNTHIYVCECVSASAYVCIYVCSCALVCCQFTMILKIELI